MRLLAIACLASIFFSYASAQPANNDTLAAILGEYRTAGAASTVLGGYGRKLKESLGRNVYEHHGLPPWTNLEAREVLAATVDQNELRRLNVDVTVVLGEAGVKRLTDTTEKFQIVFFELPLGELVSDLRDILPREGLLLEQLGAKDMRIVTTVGIAMEYDFARELEGSVTLSAADGTAELGFSRERTGRTNVTLDRASIVAYRISRVCWSATGQVQTLIRDQRGGDRCPKGTTDYRRGS